MKMRKILIIIKREFKESVYKKSFIITTILMPVIMLALVFLPAMLSSVDVKETTKIDVVDFSGIIFDSLLVHLNDAKLEDGNDKFILTKEESNPDTYPALKEDLKKRISDEKINGFIYIPASIVESGEVEYYARNVSNFDLNREIRNTINDIIITHRINKSGLKKELVTELTRRVDLKTVKIKKGEEETESGFLQEYFATFAFVMILYVTILIYGASIMRGVLEEKTSRVVEILLSTANSFQLMVGKIIGLGSVGLTQYLIWSLFGIGIIFYGAALNPAAANWFDISPSIFFYFIIFFILGYFLFATIYAAIGAMTNSDQEAQQLSTPVVLIIIVPIIVFSFIVKNPDSSTSVILSMIPFFSPILMFARINLASPPPLEIWTAIFILVVTIFILIYLVARIYRIGILMYGKKPNLPELMRWIKTK
jgi:ABC-2 type transport system permease protein